MRARSWICRKYLKSKKVAFGAPKNNQDKNMKHVMASSPSKKEHPFDSDLPLTDPSHDRLKRDPFAKELAEHIGSWQGEESIVIGINGDWGSGKSTVKNFIIHHLNKRNSKPTLIDFNPWEWSGQKKLIEGFFSEIGIALGKHDSAKKYRDLAKKWNRFASHLQFATSIGKTAKIIAQTVFGTSLVTGLLSYSASFELAQWQTILIALLILFSWAAAFIPAVLNATVELFKEEASFHDKSIQEVKKDLRQSLAKIDAPVVVFLDDVDRLTNIEIIYLIDLTLENLLERASRAKKQDNRVEMFQSCRI